MGEPTPEEVAEVLRQVDFAMRRAGVALIAFCDRHQIGRVERDYERLESARKRVKALLDRLPPEEPMSPEQAEKVGAVVAAALAKRFGDGTAEGLSAAIGAAWPEEGADRG